jgi:hypothetical protein
LPYNLCNFLRTLATPEPIKDWSLTSLKEKLIKIGAKVVSHGRYVVFQMAEVAANVPEDIAAYRGTAAAATTSASMRRSMVMRSGATDGRSVSEMPRKTARSVPRTLFAAPGMPGIRPTSGPSFFAIQKAATIRFCSAFIRRIPA